MKPTLLDGGVPIGNQVFSDRFAFGCYLVELLKPFDQTSISFDRCLWSWLAAFYFEQLCPRDEQGTRALRKSYIYAKRLARRHGLLRRGDRNLRVFQDYAHSLVQRFSVRGSSNLIV